MVRRHVFLGPLIVRYLQGVFWVGAVMFVLSFVLPVEPHAITGGGEAWGWRMGFEQYMYYFYLLIMIPSEIYAIVQEYSGRSNEVLYGFIWGEVSVFWKILTILFASTIITLRLVLFRRIAIVPIQMTPLRVVLALTLWAAAYCLVALLWDSSRITVSGQLHVGIGAYLWVSSYLLIGFTLLFTRRSTS